METNQLSVFGSGVASHAPANPVVAAAVGVAGVAGGPAGRSLAGSTGGGAARGVSPLVDRFVRVADADTGLLDEVAVAALLGDVAGLQRFLQAREIDLNQRLRQLAAQRPGVDPAAINAQATGRSAGGAGRAMQRADEAGQAPALKASMDEGRLSGEHLDAFASALRSLEPRCNPLYARWKPTSPPARLRNAPRSNSSGAGCNARSG